MSKIKKQLDLIFPENQVTEPVICKLSRKYEVCFNIRRAKVTETTGELVLEFTGEEKEVNKAIKYLEKRNIDVEPVTHDIIE
ncbi:MAG: NIL domain-containing protein [Elusimicrobiota bacterium]